MSYVKPPSDTYLSLLDGHHYTFDADGETEM